MDLWKVELRYSSEDSHEACGWMAVEGWIRGECPFPPAAPGFAFPVQGLSPSFALGSLKGGRWILGFLGGFPLPIVFPCPCIPLRGETEVEKLDEG